MIEKRPVQIAFGVVAVVATFLAIRVVTNSATPAPNPTLLWLGACWAVLPPVWFILEWAWWRGTDKELEHFKYSQELARNIWLGVGVAIALFLKV